MFLVGPFETLALHARRIARFFDAARSEARAYITKDRDFAELSRRLGPPPGVILLTLGNTSTTHLIKVLEGASPQALDLIAAGEALIEIGV